MTGLAQDVRFGLRLFRNDPGFAVTAVLTLALGIAANATVFSWIDTSLLHPAPGVAETNRLAAIVASPSSGEIMQCSHPDFRELQRSVKLLSGVAASHASSYAIGPPESMQRVWGQVVSANFFSVLGVRPSIGRVFSPEEDTDAEGAHPFVVLSYRLWRSAFHADPGVIGKTVRLNGRELAIIGVTPPEFRGTFSGLALDVWVPLSMVQKVGAISSWPAADRGANYLELVARLRPGATMEQAAAEIDAISRRIGAAYPAAHRGMTIRLLPFWRAQIVAMMLLAPLRILAAVAILVLMIACANVANLLLARAASRDKEFGIRLALGGTPWRLVRQLWTEVLLLAGAGAVVGYWLTGWMAESLVYLLPQNEFPIVFSSGLNSRVALAAAAACVMAAAISAIMPAMYCVRTDVNESLKQGGRSGTTGAHSHRVRGLLVISEVALAAVALIGAALFARSFQGARNLHPGFDANNVLVAHFYLANAGYSAEQEKQFCRRLRERVDTAPGVLDMSYSTFVPLGFGDSSRGEVEVEGYAPRPNEDLQISQIAVSPGYSALLKIPYVAGRDFTDADDKNAARVAVVNQAFARRFFTGGDGLGRRIKTAGWWWIVVGVVKDSKYRNPAEAPRPVVFLPFQQGFLIGWNTYVFVRTAGPLKDAMTTLRREVTALDPMAGLFDAMPLVEQTEAALYPQKVAASLLGALGTLSLLLAAIGLYSVMAYSVTERTKEIGIRMAMGAQPGEMLGMVLRKGMGLTTAGLAAGIAAALVAARLVGSMLPGVSAADPIAVGAAALFLAAVALLASYIPARRATKVDPIVTLRCQ
jgi:predicted permease